MVGVFQERRKLSDNGLKYGVQKLGYVYRGARAGGNNGAPRIIMFVDFREEVRTRLAYVAIIFPQVDAFLW